MGKQIIREIADGLTVAEARFAALYCTGVPAAAAVRQAFGMQRAPDQRVYERASRLLRRPQVATRVRELLAAAKIHDINSAGRAHRELLADMEAARAAQNWTALAAFSRIRVGILGMLKLDMHVTFEGSLSDADLVGRLAGDDRAVAAVLRGLLIPASFDA